MNNKRTDYFVAEQFRQQGHRLVDQLAEFMEQSTGQAGTVVANKVLDYQNPDELYQKWKSAERGQRSFEDLIAELASQSIRLHHPRYMGHQISPPSVTSALAGLANDLLNNGMGVYEMGMAGTVLERIVVEMVGERFGFGEQAGGVLTSGGSLGNLTALLAARNTRMAAFENADSMRPAIMVSEQAHYCLQRVVSIMGWKKQGLISVPVNDRFQMNTSALPDLLQQAQANGQTVIAVVGSACSTATGSYDDLNAIGEFCREHDLWFHVDGAHGAAVAFTEKYRDLLDGIEMADSVVLDFHKLLLTPALATTLVFRDRKNGYQAFSQKADYLFDEHEQETQWHNLALRTFECTKLMMSLKIYSIYNEHGINAWQYNVTRLYDLARRFATMIDQDPKVQLLVQPQSNIVCYRYVACPESQRDDLNKRIRDQVLRQGKFYIVETAIDGVHWLRSTIGSVTTTESVLQELVNHIVEIGDHLKQSQG